MMVSESPHLYRETNLYTITGLMLLDEFRKIYGKPPLMLAYVEYQMVCFSLFYSRIPFNVDLLGQAVTCEINSGKF
jgi:hypothetical protein